MSDTPTITQARVGGVTYDLKDATLTAAIAPVEAASTATRSYTAGELLIADNVLYRATAAIAAGDPIVAGANVAATTVGDAIAAVAEMVNAPRLLTWADDFAGAAGYVKAGVSDETVPVGGEGTPTITTSATIKAYVAACAPGDRFMLLHTRIPGNNARPMLFLGAASGGVRPILSKPTSSTALSLVTAPAGAEMVVFNANSQGAGLTYYIGAEGAAAVSLAPVEADTALANYAAGDLLTVDGALYQATQAIAAGGAITPGINVETTTIAAKLAALEARIAALEG